MESTNTRWVDFYQHKAADHKNRTLVDLWTQTFDELEKNHDFIQWMFPLPEPSPVNPLAPLLDANTLAAAQQNNQVKQNLLRSFDTMAAFWGFTRNDEGGVQPSAQFSIQSKKWCCYNDHNQLRLTRMLRCMSLIGHHDLASRTVEFLLMQIAQAGIDLNSVSSINYWIQAVEDVDELELTMEDFEENSIQSINL